MKLVIDNNKIIATVSDDFMTEMETISCPDIFHPMLIDFYIIKEDKSVSFDSHRYLKQVAQENLDKFAQEKHYDNMLTLCSYASDINPVYAKDAKIGLELRSSYWSKIFEIIADIESGKRPQVTLFEEIESELPVLQWKAETQEVIPEVAKPVRKRKNATT
jgi:hypothetical protein